MTRTDPYLSVSEFKARINLNSTAQDAAIETVLRAASRWVDNYCGRFFGQTDSEVHYVTAGLYRSAFPTGYGVGLAVDEFSSLTEIATDDGTLAYATVLDPDDYRFLPLEAEALGEPYTVVELLSNLGWPTMSNGVRLTGAFGWPSVPDPIIEAVHLLANRQRALWTAPFGNSGMGEMGSGLNMTAATTPLIREMLEPYRVLAV